MQTYKLAIAFYASCAVMSVQAQTLNAAVDVLKASAFPPGFSGYSCDRIASGLNSQKLKKDEFETSKQYSARMAGLKDKFITDAIKFSEPLAFIRENYTIRPTYNAEKSRFEISAYLDAHDAALASNGIIIHERMNIPSEYIASNAFGATLKVQKTQKAVCAAYFSGFSFDKGQRYSNFTVPMKPQEARDAKDRLGLIYIGEVAQPYLVKHYDHNGPTIDYAYDTTETGDAVVIHLRQIVVYNKVTGAIYMRKQVQ